MMRAVISEVEFFSLYREFHQPTELNRDVPETIGIGDTLTMLDVTTDSAGDVEFRVLGLFIDKSGRRGRGQIRAWVEPVNGYNELQTESVYRRFQP